MNFDQLAAEFSRLNPLDVYLLVRSVSDPFSDNDLIVSKLLRENNLVERFGNVAACSNVEKPEGWEQAILLVDRRSVLQQKAYADWLEVANDAAALCLSMGVRNFNSGHDQIIKFVRAIDIELPSQNKTEFVDLFRETKGFSFDSTKGLVTSIEDIPKKSARYCRSLIACEPQDEDGLFENDRILIWGGIKYSLTPNQALAFKLLVDAYPGDVTEWTFQDKGIRSLRNSFRFNQKERQKRGRDYHSSWYLIRQGSVKDSRRLIDPSIVRNDPEKFSDPQHNPQEPPR